MRTVFDSIRKVATTDAPVLILGESGTGKEMAAQAIHRRSARKDGPFIAINCSAIPETFWKANCSATKKARSPAPMPSARDGSKRPTAERCSWMKSAKFRCPLQVKLLRFLQEQCIERVGGRQEIQIDARVIAATNADLKKGMAAGTFREDLFYRLAVVQIVLPPLRDRGKRHSPAGAILPATIRRAGQQDRPDV